MSDRVLVHEEVAEALRDGRPVVALESAVITCGLPRGPAGPGVAAGLAGWRDEGDLNLEAARLQSRAVRGAGAVPAAVAVIDGRLRIGLDDDELVRLAAAPGAGKVASGDLAHALSTGATAGTTVSATLVACRLTNPPLDVFATGGIGGVHQGWSRHLDVSADLLELGRTACAVVCAGVKALLDVPATLEALESLGVAVAAWRTDRFPLFLACGGDRLAAPTRVDAIDVLATLCRIRWRALRQGAAVLVARPPDPDRALQGHDLATLVAAARDEAGRTGVRGPALTPFVLAEMARRSDGRTIRANLGVLAGNAALATELAVALRAGAL